jgi:FixJ family two-component response regulator
MNTQDLNVSIVDDDDRVRHALGGVFLSRGYGVKTFPSGEEFLRSPSVQQGGCVLLDLRMEPGMNGLQVFDELRKRGSPLVVVFLSGHGTIPDSVVAMKDGAADWLQKPCDEQRLLEVVNLALGRAVEVVQRHKVKMQRVVRWRALTAREAEVAGHVRLGKRNKVIARNLDIDVRTVEAHRAHVYQKLEIENPSELDRYMRDMDL